MEPEVNAAEQVKAVLIDIESGACSAYEGFKKVRWIADLYMVYAEMVGEMKTDPISSIHVPDLLCKDKVSQC